MPSDPTRIALHDIKDNALPAKMFIAGFTLENFAADLRTFYAVTRCLEIISEAARRLPAELRERHQKLPWRAIMGSGNIYRHNYDNVAEAFVWQTVQHSLEPLLEAIEIELLLLNK